MPFNEATLQSEDTYKPASSKRWRPFWKLFSTTIPTPTVVAFACFTMSLRPSEASPLAKKSSMISTLSSGSKNSSDTMTVLVLFFVNE